MSGEIFPIEPLGELVFVEPVDWYRGTIIVIEQRPACRGCVLAVGPGRPLPDGSAVPMEVKPGDYIHFGPATGMEGVFCNRRVLSMREEDILAVEEPL